MDILREALLVHKLHSKKCKEHHQSGRVDCDVGKFNTTHGEVREVNHTWCSPWIPPHAPLFHTMLMWQPYLYTWPQHIHCQQDSYITHTTHTHTHTQHITHNTHTTHNTTHTHTLYSSLTLSVEVGGGMLFYASLYSHVTSVLILIAGRRTYL